MVVFDFVLGGCWKSTSRSFNGGAVSMLFVVVLAAMFVAAESANCLNGKTLKGPCKQMSVNVKSNSDTITAIMEIKGESGEFTGSIIIGNCIIKGVFSRGTHSFKPDNGPDLYGAPIKIEATPTAVTFQSGSNAKHKVCKKSPFALGDDGKAQTTITLNLDQADVVDLKLDDSLTVVFEDENTEKNLTALLLILAIILITLAVVISCCCKKDEECDADVKYDGMNNPVKKSVKQAAIVEKPKVPEKIVTKVNPKTKQPEMKKTPEFQVPERFCWPSDRFTTEYCKTLCAFIPLTQLSLYEIETRALAFLKKHPIENKEQLKLIKEEEENCKRIALCKYTESGRTRSLDMWHTAMVLRVIIDCWERLEYSREAVSYARRMAEISRRMKEKEAKEKEAKEKEAKEKEEREKKRKEKEAMDKSKKKTSAKDNDNAYPKEETCK
ncbi:hypothetical protein M3Y96_01009900 [Aphelenchoides besseyi]|nr:hypothetical protein M3Y96_01009900 [Aphelenchoides besseyi]